MSNTERDKRYHNPEEEIRNAMQRGDFDNLAGKGKPVRLRRNPHLSPEEELAYNLLQDAGYVPDWIEEQREIIKEIEALRRTLTQAWLDRLARLERANALPTAQADVERVRSAWAWEQAERRFRATMADTNRRIRDYNLKAPMVSLHMLSLRADEELRRLEMEHPAPEPTEPTPEAESMQTEAALLSDGVRQIVTTRERTPRSPAWDAAWKRTLWRFSRRLRAFRRKE